MYIHTHSWLKVLSTRVFQGEGLAASTLLVWFPKKNSGSFIFGLLQLFWSEQFATLLGIRQKTKRPAILLLYCFSCFLYDLRRKYFDRVQ